VFEYVLVVVRAADGARLASLNTTNNVHDRITLEANHGTFNGDDDAGQTSKLHKVLVVAPVCLVAAVLLFDYTQPQVIMLYNIRGGRETNHCSC
jgi:hypothetical protein